MAALKAKAAMIQKEEPAAEPEMPNAEPPMGDPSRPIPTPCRALAVLPRPVSSDAQPTEQQVWEQAFADALVDQVSGEETSGLGHTGDAGGSEDELIDPAARKHYTNCVKQLQVFSRCMVQLRTMMRLWIS